MSFVWGCRHAGYCGQWLTSAISFIHSKLGLEKTNDLFNILNYADDFAGAEDNIDKATLSFNLLGNLLAEIGLIEAEDKACPPSKRMTYLGVLFDTDNMAIYVDEDKVTELKSELAKWGCKSVTRKRDLQSILGKLLWVSKAVRNSRIFVGRIIAVIRSLKFQSSKTTLSNEIKKDFLWWEKFLEKFSGVELIPPITVSQSVLGDAYPKGGGSWNPVKRQYFSMKFPEYMCSDETPIHIKEFIVVLLSIRMWGKDWTGQRILILCDNDSVCDTCTYQKPRDPSLQMLLREFLYWVCSFNFQPVLQKISSSDNHFADFLSRNHDVKDIDDYFTKYGYPSQEKVLVPLNWFNFVADW